MPVKADIKTDLLGLDYLCPVLKQKLTTTFNPCCLNTNVDSDNTIGSDNHFYNIETKVTYTFDCVCGNTHTIIIKEKILDILFF